MTPHSAHPRNAATHSAQFGLHKSTASPLLDVARLKLAGKLIGQSGDAPVAPTLAPVSARKHVGAVFVFAPALEIVESIE